MSELNRNIYQGINGQSTIIVDIQQGTDAWLDWRKDGITASDVPIILGLSPYKTPWRLWAEKVGRINPEDLSKNPNVQRGHRLEDKARQLAEARYGKILLPLCGEYYDWPTLKASFDGLCDGNIPHEFKAPSQEVFDEVAKLGNLSPSYIMYEAQTQGQCIVAGADEGRLIFYIEDENGDSSDLDFPISLTIERKEEILSAVKVFREYVKTNTPPPIDPERDVYIPSTGDERFYWESNAEAWRLNKARIATLESELKALKADNDDIRDKLVQQMGDFMQSDFNGIKVTRFEKQGIVDYKNFLKAKFPDQDLTAELELFRKSSSLQSRISKSDDGLVNVEPHEVVSDKKAAFF